MRNSCLVQRLIVTRVARLDGCRAYCTGHADDPGWRCRGKRCRPDRAGRGLRWPGHRISRRASRRARGAARPGAARRHLRASRLRAEEGAVVRRAAGARSGAGRRVRFFRAAPARSTGSISGSCASAISTASPSATCSGWQSSGISTWRAPAGSSTPDRRGRRRRALACAACRDRHRCAARGGWICPVSSWAWCPTTCSLCARCRRRMAVVGGGYVAIEFAGLLRALGCEVTVLARGRLLDGFDAELVDALVERMQHDGIRLIQPVRISAARQRGAMGCCWLATTWPRAAPTTACCGRWGACRTAKRSVWTSWA